jgi:hypothetical protein
LEEVPVDFNQQTLQTIKKLVQDGELVDAGNYYFSLDQGDRSSDTESRRNATEESFDWELRRTYLLVILQ